MREMEDDSVNKNQESNGNGVLKTEMCLNKENEK